MENVYLLVPTLIFDMRKVEVENAYFMQFGKEDMNLFSSLFHHNALLRTTAYSMRSKRARFSAREPQPPT